MQTGILREQVVLIGSVGLADQAVEGGAAEIPGGVHRHVRAHAALQPVDAGKAIETEQVGVGEFEIETVFVRILVDLAVAGLRRDDDLRDRLDDLGAPGAGIAHEWPVQIQRRLRQAHAPYRRSFCVPKFGCSLKSTGIVSDRVVVQRELPQIAERPTNGRSQFSVRLARRVLVPSVRTTLKKPASS